MAKTPTAALLTVALCAAGTWVPSRADAGSRRTPIPGSRAAWATSSHRRAEVRGAQAIRLRVYLNLRDRAGAERTARAVSDPASSRYRQHLTPADVRGRFAPTTATVDAVRSWLARGSIRPGYVPPNRMFVEATGTAAAVQHAFGVHLGLYDVQGRRLRAADRPLSVPTGLAGAVAGVIGVDQSLSLLRPLHIGPDPTGPRGASGARIVPPGKGFRNARPCGHHHGAALDRTDPSFGGYSAPLPYAPCGYTPDQLRAAYGVDAALAHGVDGRSTKVAIVDAFASPTVVADATTYARRHDPHHPLRPGQVEQVVFPPDPRFEGPCDAAGWYAEETLDVEAVHATAPGAGIVYVGGSDCQDVSLDKALNEVVARHLAPVVSNSYGNIGEAVPDDVALAFQDITLEAALTGIGVYFSSGDAGDEVARLGKPSPDFPASSPWATAVGGTSLGLDHTGHPTVETGWETAKSILGNGVWTPPPPGQYQYGSGGGTSTRYPQPFYQRGVVPTELAAKNQTAGHLGRVVPDISVVGDPNTGMLVGTTQSFPEGAHYGEHRIGGTSLSSPLFAGLVALADQLHGPHGFLNPAIYGVKGRGTITDVQHRDGAVVRRDYVNGLDADQGITTSIRTFDAPGLTISTLPGYDDVTGLGRPDGLRFLRRL
ncbi:MAG: serine protease [Acidimicrobiales bacterium]|nr:serine protease [Acidimicrobiales bacterium]